MNRVARNVVVIVTYANLNHRIVVYVLFSDIHPVVRRIPQTQVGMKGLRRRDNIEEDLFRYVSLRIFLSHIDFIKVLFEKLDFFTRVICLLICDHGN